MRYRYKDPEGFMDIEEALQNKVDNAYALFGIVLWGCAGLPI